MGTAPNLHSPRPASVGFSNMRLAPRLGVSREACGNPSCSGGWLTFLKDRRRPVFDGRWACTAACVEELVKRSVRRESAEGGASQAASDHRHRIPLGLILLGQGWITQAQLERALDMQRRAGTGRIGYWLVDVCGFEQTCITRALSLQWGCPTLTAEGFDPAAMALAVPRLLLEQLGILPLRIAASRILYLAFADQLDAAAAFAMERMSALKVQSGVLGEAEWAAARQRIYESSFVDCAFEHAPTQASLSTKIASVVTRTQPRASRLVRVHQFYWLRMWLESGAMSAADGGFPATREDILDRVYTVGTEQ
jgi:hypothetical protein